MEIQCLTSCDILSDLRDGEEDLSQPHAGIPWRVDVAWMREEHAW